jgi:hypothetical protein
MPEPRWYDESQTYWCAFCNEEIAHLGYDPVMVYAEASRVPGGTGGAWSFTAHAVCIRDAFDPGYAHDIPREIYTPGGTETPYGPRDSEPTG